MVTGAGAEFDTVTVHVYTVCWNEEKIMPYFLRYYSAFADRIVVYDNMSTDSTRDIVQGCPKAELREFETNDELNDVEQTRIKNSAYKESRGEADFVIVVDSDEFIYHPQLEKVLREYKRQGVTLPKIRGYDMISWRFPVSLGDITSLVRLGRRRDHYSKRGIFDPGIDINFSEGSHHCSPLGDVVESSDQDLYLLHYHYVGLLRCIRRHRVMTSRLGEWYENRPDRAAQYRWGTSRVVAQFVRSRLKSHDVVRQRRSLLSTLVAPVFGVRKILQRSVSGRPTA